MTERSQPKIETALGLKSMSGIRTLSPEQSDFLCDAADEIERLRAELASARKALEPMTRDPNNPTWNDESADTDIEPLPARAVSHDSITDSEWSRRLGIKCHHPDGVDQCGCPHYSDPKNNPVCKFEQLTKSQRPEGER